LSSRFVEENGVTADEFDVLCALLAGGAERVLVDPHVNDHGARFSETFDTAMVAA
jgi:hypothetical protein